MRASRSGKSSCAATPTVKLLRRDGRPAHGYHGSREHGNERNAGGLHRSGFVRAGTGAGDAHWRDVLMLSAERSKGERGATLCVAPCKLRQKQKGVNHGPFAQKAPQRPPVARSHCAGSTNGGTSWLASAGVHYAVCTLCRCTRPEGQSPDLTSSTHREVQLTRSAALARAAGKRLRRAADPTDLPGRAAAAAGAHVWHGRVRARNVWRGGAA